MLNTVQQTVHTRARRPQVADDSAAWALLDHDKGSRGRRERALALTIDRSDAAASFASPGTCVAFFARPGNPLLEAIREAAGSGEAARIKAVGSAIVSYFRGIQQVRETPTDTARRMMNLSSYGELRAGSKVLHRYVAVTEARPLGAVVLPYTGGTLSEGAISLVEFSRDACAPALDVVLIAREPNLSAVERAAMDAAAAQSSEAVIGESQNTIFTGALIAVLLMTLTGTACIEVPKEMAAIGLDDDEVRALGARGSAKKLLALRQQVLARR